MTLVRTLIVAVVTLASIKVAAVVEASPFDDLLLDDVVHASADEAFIPHVGAGPYGSYLAMVIPFAPVKALYEQVQTASGQTLITRGEAHVTVVTPVEFDQQLKSHLTIEQINALAVEANIQATHFDVVCLGQGKLTNADAELFTYFVVVDSDGLRDLRRAIHAAFVAAGGDAMAFDPERFYPHVTVGYSVRDLHLEDGVVKDRSSCVGDL